MVTLIYVGAELLEPLEHMIKNDVMITNTDKASK
jgi:hypothetical protein